MSAGEFPKDAASLDTEIALVDIYLPRISGIELLKRLESTGGGPAVILMTAHGENETAGERVVDELDHAESERLCRRRAHGEALPDP